ncbi:MAG: FAD-dependent oxidoreductase [Anaerolineae bacterium]|nr:FAD-dependent oxidoreductase [Anaerolineae bacterium]
MSDCFDYLIVGAGAAGLSLAYHLQRAGLTSKRILLIDRAPKAGNDRTWCFWEAGESPFEPLVFRRWERVAFHGENFSAVLSLLPYRYKMIRSADFYAFFEDWLPLQTNIERRFLDVVAVEDGGDHARVIARDGTVLCGEWAFSSVMFAPPCAQGDAQVHCWWQHFLGWVVRAPRAAFDPETATLMDFRVAQGEDEVRFVYVLPFDAHTALVEFTVFSRAVWAREAYCDPLRAYLCEHLGLREYAVLEEELGVIPMTDARFAAEQGRVIRIGTAGGDTKPSTGYTFQRVQRRTQAIARALAQGRTPRRQPSFRRARHALFDSVLLNVLDERRDRGVHVFTDLFARNPTARVLRFLDEDTSLLEELCVMSSVNKRAFLTATAAVLLKRLRAAFG